MAGMKQKKIALEIGVHPSTISRELESNIAKRCKILNNILLRKLSKKKTKTSNVNLKFEFFIHYDRASC